MKEKNQSEVKRRYLVSLNTARIKLRKKHPRISQDLEELFDLLKDVNIDTGKIYKSDGLLDIDD